MRSVDVFLGLPFNMASYALLAHMVAGVTGLTPGTLTWSGNCVHLYSNHLGYVEEQLERDTYALPRIELAPARCLDDYVPGDFTLRDYHAHPNWKNVPVAV
jgi:thymidylate synthase